MYGKWEEEEEEDTTFVAGNEYIECTTVQVTYPKVSNCTKMTSRKEWLAEKVSKIRTRSASPTTSDPPSRSTISNDTTPTNTIPTQSTAAILQNEIEDSEYEKKELKQKLESNATLHEQNPTSSDMERLLKEARMEVSTFQQKYHDTCQEMEDMETQFHGQQVEYEKRLEDQKSLVQSRDEMIGNLHDKLDHMNHDLTMAEEEKDHIQREFARMKRNQEDDDNDDKQQIHLKEKDERIESLQEKVDMYRVALEEEKKTTQKVLEIKTTRIKELESDLNSKITRMESMGKKEETHSQGLTNDIVRLETELAVEKKRTHEMAQDITTQEATWNKEKTTFLHKIAEMETEMKNMSTLKEKLDETEKELNAVKASSGNSTTAKRALMLAMEKKSKRDAFDSGSNIESAKKIQDLEQEIKELKQKLSDRDKTISATIKASSMQEKKIDTLRKRVAELEADITSDDKHKQNEEAVSELHETVTTLQNTKQNMAKQIAELHKQISDMRSKGVSSTPSLNDTLIQDYKFKIQERDDAISSLVKTSIAQEQHITNLRDEMFELKGKTGHVRSSVKSNGPTWDEFHKVQQESEMFAGQIIELDEEIEELRHRLEDSSKAVDNEVIFQHEATIKRLYTSLQKEEDINRNLEDEISDLRSKLKKKSNVSRIQLELEEVEESNTRLEQEIRELRRKLRASQLESEKVPDLESELSILRENLNKLQLESTKRQLDKVVDMKTQVDFERAIEQRDAFESQLRESLAVNHNLEQSVKSHIEKENELLKDIALIRVERDDLLKMMKTYQEKEKEMQIRSINEKEIEDMNSRKVSDFQLMKMQELENDIDEQNNIIGALTNEVKRLRSKTSNDSEANDIIIALTDEVKKLRERHLSNDSSSDIIKALSDEVKTLRTKLQATNGDYDKDKVTDMEAQITGLKNEIKKLREAPSKVTNESDMVKELKKQLEEAEKGRTQFEKTMISTYERKLNLMQMNKDVTIDGLRKELTKSKAIQKESETELINKIRNLENERREFEAELQAKMQHKNARIEFLEQHLSAHEQVSGHMRDDLDQLQSRMENMSVGRRAEMEELQEDLIDAQSKITKYERDITSLKMKMEEAKLTHQNEVSRLQRIIDSIESDNQTPMMRDVAKESEKRLEKEYRSQMESFQSKINGLQEENRNLKYEIEKIEKQASRNDKWRNSALQEQVIKLQQRLKEYESETGSVVSAPSRRKSSSSTPRVPRSPATSFNSGRRDDLSTYTEDTF